jgi:hypothetical protein
LCTVYESYKFKRELETKARLEHIVTEEENSLLVLGISESVPKSVEIRLWKLKLAVLF